MGRNGGIFVLVAVLIGLFVFARHSSDPPPSGQDPPAFGGSGSVTAHLSVVPTIRSVTVSPGSVRFGECTGGAGNTPATAAPMGYPHASCCGGRTRAGRGLPPTAPPNGPPRAP